MPSWDFRFAILDFRLEKFTIVNLRFTIEEEGGSEGGDGHSEYGGEASASIYWFPVALPSA